MRVYGDARDISLREILFGGGDQLPGDTAAAGVLLNNQRQNASAEIIVLKTAARERADHAAHLPIAYRNQRPIKVVDLDLLQPRGMSSSLVGQPSSRTSNRPTRWHRSVAPRGS